MSGLIRYLDAVIKDELAFSLDGLSCKVAGERLGVSASRIEAGKFRPLLIVGGQVIPEVEIEARHTPLLLSVTLSFSPRT